MGNLCCGTADPSQPKVYDVGKVTSKKEKEAGYILGGTYSEEEDLENTTHRRKNTFHRKKEENPGFLDGAIHVPQSNMERKPGHLRQSRRPSRAVEAPKLPKDELAETLLKMVLNLKLELAAILPDISEAWRATVAKFDGKEEKLKKSKRKLRKLIDDCKQKFYLHYYSTLSEMHGLQFESCLDLESYLKEKAEGNSELESVLEDIDKSIQLSLEGQFQDSDLNICLHDKTFTRDMYEKVIFKFCAALRHNLYIKIRAYVATNRAKINHLLHCDKESDDSHDFDQNNMLPEEVVNELAENIDNSSLFVAVLRLYRVRWALDIDLTKRQMEYIYQQKEPCDAEFNDYMSCHLQAHEQLLLKIQDPNLRFREMEKNPLKNTDVMFGVPPVFREYMVQVEAVMKGMQAGAPEATSERSEHDEAEPIPRQQSETANPFLDAALRTSLVGSQGTDRRQTEAQHILSPFDLQRRKTNIRVSEEAGIEVVPELDD